MSDVLIRIEGRAGRITLNRPAALNALTWEMCLAIEAALDAWAGDPDVSLVLIDGAGDRAFCAGGDIALMYETTKKGNLEFGRAFWRDEYRMNAKLYEFPKPVVSFLHGFVMGGGVGVGCHASHRIVCETSKVAMPECAIGLVPDVGGTLWLARAPGRLGEFLGVTGERMDAGDAIYAGFADYYLPEAEWPALKADLCDQGDVLAVDRAAHPSPPARMSEWQADIDVTFSGERLADCVRSFDRHPSPAVDLARAAIARNSPLSMCVTVENVHRVRARDDIRFCLGLEYRFTHRSAEESDFIEGIRAAIIDKDRAPKWRHAGWDAVPGADVVRMTQPVPGVELTFEKETAMKIGFIGLGNMGAPMARNLLAAGHEVAAFDPVAAPEGLTLVASATEAAAGAEIVITMLPNGAILRAVAAEIHPVMPKGAVHLDCSTVDVDSARAVAETALTYGLDGMDAPVSGGVGGAAAGTLTFMAGGSEAAFSRVLPLFEVMGQKAVHCGPSGAGQAAKICNNMILGVTMIATCEAFALADKLGLDRQKMFDVVSTSSGYSWSMNAYCPAPGVGPKSPADNGYRPGFAAELMLKDLGLSQQAAESADADTPMGQLALSLYRRFVEEEDGRGQDFSAMLPRFEKRHRG